METTCSFSILFRWPGSNSPNPSAAHHLRFGGAWAWRPWTGGCTSSEAVSFQTGGTEVWNARVFV
eukprot:3674920-Rhodomonas_salina.2